MTRHARFALGLAVASLVAACGGESSTQPEPTPSELPIAYSFDPDGLERARDIYLTRADGTGARKLLDLGSDEVQPEWSPDGKTLLLWQSTIEGRLLLVNDDGSNSRELLAPYYGVARWSPDGAWIAYADVPIAGSVGLKVMRSDGTERRILALAAGGASLSLPTWSTTGRIAYVFSRGVYLGSEIWTVRADGTQSASPLVTGGDDEWPAWSPDGSMLAYSACTGLPGDTTCQLALMNADGTGRRVLASDGVWNVKPTWSPDGKWILYENWQSTTGGCSFVRISPSGGARTTVVPATARSVCGGASWR